MVNMIDVGGISFYAEIKMELDSLELDGADIIRPRGFRGNRTVYWAKPSGESVKVKAGAADAKSITVKKDGKQIASGTSEIETQVSLDNGKMLTEIEIAVTGGVKQGDGTVSEKTRKYYIDVCGKDPTSHDVVVDYYGLKPMVSSIDGTKVFADQLSNNWTLDLGNPMHIKFIAENFVGSEKNNKNLIEPVKAINPDWHAQHYHLAIWIQKASIIIDDVWTDKEWHYLTKELVLKDPGIFMYAKNKATGNFERLHDMGQNGYLMNIMNETYYNWLLESLVFECKSMGYESIFLDSYDLPTVYSFTGSAYEYFDGTDLMKVKIDQLGGITWTDALEEFISRLTKDLNKKGIWNLPNISPQGTMWDPVDYAYSNGGMTEGAFHAPDSQKGDDEKDENYLHDWKQSMSRYMYLEEHDKIIHYETGWRNVNDYNERMMQVAMYHLVRGNHSYYVTGGPDPELGKLSQLSWWPEYDIDLGKPLYTAPVGEDAFKGGNYDLDLGLGAQVDRAIEGYKIAENNLYMRPFENGVAVLNPHADGRRYTIPNDGKAYKLVTTQGGGVIREDGQKRGTLDYTPVSGEIVVPAHGAVIVVTNK